jgi:outer membrane protein TolC
MSSQRRRQSLPVIRSALLIVVAAGAISAEAKADLGLMTSKPLAASAETCVLDADGARWWAAFGDAALNLLVSMAATRNGSARTVACLQPELTSAYVQLRVLDIRSALLRSMQETLSRQATMLAAPSGTADAAQQLVAARDEQIAEQLQEVQKISLHHLHFLSARTGLTEEQLLAALAPVLAERAVPVFRMPVPVRLPAEVLRRRSDVAAMERQQRLPASSPPLQGWIVAQAPQTQGDDAEDALSQPRAEVAQALRALADAHHTTLMLTRLVASRQVEFESTRQRQAIGQASALEAAERYFLMLFDSHRLATASGDVALAWIRLQRRTGGAVGDGSARSDDMRTMQERQ